MKWDKPSQNSQSGLITSCYVNVIKYWETQYNHTHARAQKKYFLTKHQGYKIHVSSLPNLPRDSPSSRHRPPSCAGWRPAWGSCRFCGRGRRSTSSPCRRRPAPGTSPAPTSAWPGTAAPLTRQRKGDIVKCNSWQAMHSSTFCLASISKCLRSSKTASSTDLFISVVAQPFALPLPVLPILKKAEVFFN